jgi:hypothetical protein
MEPLNKKDRTGFIIKFSASFLVGILIIMIPFYFLLELPKYEHSNLSKNLTVLERQMNYQRDTLAIQIDSLKRLVNRLDLPNPQVGLIDGEIGQYISKIQLPFINDTSWAGGMYRNIVKSYIDLKDAKMARFKLEKDLNDCKKELEKAAKDAAKPVDPMGG